MTLTVVFGFQRNFGRPVGMKWVTTSASIWRTTRKRSFPSIRDSPADRASGKGRCSLPHITTSLHQKLDVKTIWNPATGSMVLLGLIPQLLAAVGISQLFTLLSIQA